MSDMFCEQREWSALQGRNRESRSVSVGFTYGYSRFAALRQSNGVRQALSRVLCRVPKGRTVNSRSRFAALRQAKQGPEGTDCE